MKIIKTYESYNNLEDLDLGRFSKIIVKSLLIPNSDGTFDYDGDLDFNYMGLVSLKEIPIRFRKVKGNFSCVDNELISLQYAPLEVGGDFLCPLNKLTSLQYAPSKVGSFNCSFNKLTNLQYAPLEISGDFFCTSNLIKSLEGVPSVIYGHFFCSSNRLISLQYAPSKVGRDFNCSENYLISLQYAPLEVGEDFNCSENYLLSKGCSSVIKDKFWFDKNPFKITNTVIEIVNSMTYDQQMAELDFFGKYDSEAYKMFLEILDDLDVDYGTHRKEMFDRVKDNKELNTFF
jgi:hypothetical protein